MTFTPQELDSLKDVMKETVFDVVHSSHSALDEKSSNYWGEMKTEIALMQQVQQQILTQTTKTNGRVNKHDRLINIAIGAITILTVVLLPSLGYLIIQELSLTNIVSAHVGQPIQK